MVQVLEHVVLQEFITHALCKTSTNLPSQSWPGGMNAWSVSCSLAQRPTAAAMNSRLVIGTQHLGCTTRQDSQVTHVDHIDGPIAQRAQPGAGA